MTRRSGEDMAGPRRSSTPRGRQKRQQILEAAKLYFAASGYRGASTAAIAETAEITDPGLLHHFGSKEGLLMALLESRYGYDEEILAIDVESYATGHEVLERLRALVAENAGNETDVRLFSVILAESVAPDHPSHEFFAARFRHARALIRDQLEEGQRLGLIRRDVNVDGLAAALLALMDGLQYQWLLEPELDMTASFDAVVSLLGEAMTVAPDAS